MFLPLLLLTSIHKSQYKDLLLEQGDCPAEQQETAATTPNNTDDKHKVMMNAMVANEGRWIAVTMANTAQPEPEPKQNQKHFNYQYESKTSMRMWIKKDTSTKSLLTVSMSIDFSNPNLPQELIVPIKKGKKSWPRLCLQRAARQPG